jgi:hypothetical protein
MSLSRLVARLLGLCVAAVGVVLAGVGFFVPAGSRRGIDLLLSNMADAGILFAAGLAGLGFLVGGLLVLAGRGRNAAVSLGGLVLVGVVALLPVSTNSLAGLLGVGLVSLVLVSAASVATAAE